MASAQEYRNMSVKDLNGELINLRREQFNLRMQMGSGNTPKIHRFSIVRHDIARIKTVLTEMSRATEKGNS
ncbi:LSU ribosomal protein L29p (L35e) [hydrothermal vent metagenome]|uniref:LSU ribosomal protein L29p (L35e) n=1 Tax=hydrothermal vent metagenome TaxID=652676 RepID=A0A3B0XCZ3_9ZZZZ